MKEIAVTIRNNKDEQQKLQHLLDDKGWKVYFSFPLIIKDEEVQLVKVILRKKN